jgi:hypothetical protein
MVMHAFRDEYEGKPFLINRVILCRAGPTTLCHVFNLVKVLYDGECRYRLALRQFQNN